MPNEPLSRTGNGITVTVDGEDLIVRNTTASYFGDAADVAIGDDNGVGAWGFRYIDHPDYIGVALPIHSHAGGLSTSPIPALPPFTPVKVYSHTTGKVVYAHLIDVGPSAGLNRGIDFLEATLAALGLTKSAGLYHGIDYRIIGCAHLLV